MSSIRNQVLVVALNISVWEARKQDRKVTKEVAISHAIAEACGRYHKDLLPNAVEHQNILKIRNAWRIWHYTITLPWGDDAGRVLRSEDFFKYTSEYNDFKQQWDAAIAKFVTAYPALVQDAELRLNSLFDAADYPHANEVQSKFNVSMNVYPLPNADDFRIVEGLSSDEADKLCEAAVEGLEASISTAVKDVWKRMAVAVSAMHTRLSVPSGEKGGKFHDSLVDNIVDLLDLMPRLNLLKDPNIDLMIEGMEKLTLYPPELLRSMPDARSVTAERAAVLLDKINSYTI